jgi:hypothetical protein
VGVKKGDKTHCRKKKLTVKGEKSPFMSKGADKEE